jgi:hypothetical protein
MTALMDNRLENNAPVKLEQFHSKRFHITNSFVGSDDRATMYNFYTFS